MCFVNALNEIAACGFIFIHSDGPACTPAGEKNTAA